MKCLIYNDGGENLRKGFDNYLSQNVIPWKIYAPYTPHHNGVIEMENQTLVEITYNFVHTKGMIIIFWVDFIYYSNYPFDMIPTKFVWDMTILEKWSGRKPLIKHIIMFGCIAWAHTEKEFGCKESFL
jgi:hypothetical protein